MNTDQIKVIVQGKTQIELHVTANSVEHANAICEEYAQEEGLMLDDIIIRGGSNRAIDESLCVAKGLKHSTIRDIDFNVTLFFKEKLVSTTVITLPMVNEAEA